MAYPSFSLHVVLDPCLRRDQDKGAPSGALRSWTSQDTPRRPAPLRQSKLHSLCPRFELRPPPIDPVSFCYNSSNMEIPKKRIFGMPRFASFATVFIIFYAISLGTYYVSRYGFPQLEILKGKRVVAGEGCAFGGCSSEVCWDKNDGSPPFSACALRPEFNCNGYSKCERQPNGKCGWTPTWMYLRCNELIRR